MPRSQGGRVPPEGFARGFAYLCLVTAVVASACAMVAAACVMLTAVFEVRQASASAACGSEDSSALQRTALAFLRPQTGSQRIRFSGDGPAPANGGGLAQAEAAPEGCEAQPAAAGFWNARLWLVVLGCLVLLQAVFLALLLAQRRAWKRALQCRAEIALAARRSAMGVVAASIAHQINQPLGAILSNADAAEMILEQERPDLEELRAIVRDIRKDDVRASETIRAMRALVRRPAMNFSTLDVNAQLAEAIRHLSADAAARKVRIVQELGGDVPQVAGDSVQLQQAFINLMVNAMEAMQSTPEREREMHVRTCASGGGAEIAIVDRGPGIAPEDSRRVFDSFFTTKSQGTGLGLAIVRAIVDAHRGLVSAEAAAARGAVFRVWLPARSA
jgi:signal transduction histidine kinase